MQISEQFLPVERDKDFGQGREIFSTAFLSVCCSLGLMLDP